MLQSDTESTKQKSGHFSALDSLLEDDDAVDLLQAIRLWNLRKSQLSNPHKIQHFQEGTDEYPPLICASNVCDERKHVHFSIGPKSPTPFVYTRGLDQKDVEEEECTHMTVSDCTESPCSTKKSVARPSPNKQTLSIGTTSSIRGNYSTKPSSLTWRLLDHESLLSHSSSPMDLLVEPTSRYRLSHTPSITHRDDDKITTHSFSSKQHSQDALDCHPDEAISQETAFSILLDIAQALGLDRHEIHLILPTIDKLVKVIMNHVPRLEQFAHGVCQIVLDQDSSGTLSDSHRHHETHGVGRPVFKAKKKEMDAALQILQNTWKNHVQS